MSTTQVFRIQPRGIVRVVGVVMALSLGGCASQHKSLYYWGDYQPQVYDYFVAGDRKGPEAQLQALELTAQKAQSKGEALPPGFNAHRGLLYLKVGQGDKARTAFLTEKVQYPESASYMDFLLKKIDGSAVGSAGPATVAVNPPAAEASQK